MKSTTSRRKSRRIRGTRNTSTIAQLDWRDVINPYLPIEPINPDALEKNP